MKTGEGGGAHNEQEEIDELELKRDETMAMIGMGEIKDRKIILLLQHLALRYVSPKYVLTPSL